MKEKKICSFLEGKALWLVLFGVFILFVLIKAPSIWIALSILAHLVLYGALVICRLLGHATTNMRQSFNIFSLVAVVFGIIVIGNFIIRHSN